MTNAQTKIRFKSKPSVEAVKRYIKTLEYFLSPHSIRVSITLWDEPLTMYSFIDGVETDIVNHWIKDVLISNDEAKDVKVHTLSEGIDETMSDEQVWLDAWKAQEDFYKHLGRLPNPPHFSDPYWELWEIRRRG